MVIRAPKGGREGICAPRPLGAFFMPPAKASMLLTDLLITG